MNILLLGAPGAGKGTQAKLLQKEYGLQHLAPGDILRDAVKKETELGLQAKNFMDKGNLVPDELIIDMMLKKIESTDGVILDGFPRNIKQAQALTEYLKKIDKKLNYVIKIVVKENEIIRRLSSRRVCPLCGHSYNKVFNPPKVEGLCDVDGEKLIHRKDDTEETIKSRLQVFEDHTRPIIDYYKDSGVYFEVDGEKDFMEVFEDLKSIVIE